MTAPLTSLSTAIMALLGIVALILFAARLLRGRLTGLRLPVRPTAHLKLTETLALDPRRRIHLLTCDNRRVLLLTGGPSDIMLHLSQGE